MLIADIIIIILKNFIFWPTQAELVTPSLCYM